MRKVLAEFIKRFGRRPKDQLELLQFRFKLAQESGKGQVIEFPPSAITDWTKPRLTTGKKGEVIDIKKSTMSNADYGSLKEEWFGKLIANTDDDINTFLKRGIDAADERFKNLTSKQRKDFLDMVDYRLKHGNKKFMEDSQMFFKEDFAGGGIAGMLGERIGFQGGGADMGTVHGDTRRATAKSVQVSPTGVVTTSTTRGPDPVDDRASSDQNAAHMRAISEARRPKRTISGGINKVLNNPFVRTYAAWGSGGLSEKLRQAILVKKLYDTRNIDEAIEEDLRNIPITGGIVQQQFAGGGIAGMLGEPTYADDNHRVPYDSGNMVLPKEKPFQGLFHTEVGGPVITKDDSEFEAVVDRWSQFARQKGEGLEGVERNKSFALENIVRIGRELGYEDDEIKEIILRINKAAGGRVPFSRGKSAKEGLEWALKKIMDKFGERSITTASKLERPLKAIEKEKTKAMFDNLTNKINTQEALSKGSKKMAGPIENVNKKPFDMQPSSTDHTAWLKQEEFFDPKALDYLGRKVPSNWIALERARAKDTLKKLGPLPSKSHPNWEDMRKIRQGVKNRLVALDITEELGGNVAMFDFLRIQRGSPEKFLDINNYIKKAGVKKVVDELSGIKKIMIKDKEFGKLYEKGSEIDKGIQLEEKAKKMLSKMSDAEIELRGEFPGISDDLIKDILADKNPQRIAEIKAAMKEAMIMQDKGMGVEEIVNIFKKQGKKPTKHASGGLAGMLGE